MAFITKETLERLSASPEEIDIARQKGEPIRVICDGAAVTAYRYQGRVFVERVLVEVERQH